MFFCALVVRGQDSALGLPTGAGVCHGQLVRQWARTAGALLLGSKTCGPSVSFLETRPSKANPLFPLRV